MLTGTSVTIASVQVRDFSGLSGYPSIAVLSINPRIDAMCQKATSTCVSIDVGLQKERPPGGGFSGTDQPARCPHL